MIKRKITAKKIIGRGKSIFDENNQHHQRNKAQKALAKAKEMEAIKIKSGKTWVRLDGKTEVLR